MLAARRGAIVTVERIVDDIRPWAHLVKIPAHRVLALAQVPFGAHPGGLYAPSSPGGGLRRGPRVLGRRPATPAEARTSTRGSVAGCSVPPTRRSTSTSWESSRARLRRRAEPDSWRDDEAAHRRPGRTGGCLGDRGRLRRPPCRRPGRGRGIRCRARRGRGGQPVRVARQFRLAGRGHGLSSPPSSASGATNRPRPTPSCSITAASPVPPWSPTARRCSRR